MKTLFSLVILGSIATTAWAQGVIREEILRKADGTLVQNATVQVCKSGPPCNQPVNIFSDINLNTGITNPITISPNDNGHYLFYATPGSYFIGIAGEINQDLSNVVLAHNPPTVVLVANTFPGPTIKEKIDAAIAALPASGGTILISPGTYTFATTIALADKNVHLTGSGEGFDNTAPLPLPPPAGTRLIWAGATGGTAIQATNTGKNQPAVTTRLSNFSLDNSTDHIAGVGIDIDGINHAFIEHVTINPTKALGFSTAGIRVGHAAQTVDVTLRDVLVANNDVGLLAEFVSAGILLDHARFDNSTHENVKVMGKGASSPVQSFHAYGSAFDGTSTTASSVSILNCVLCVFENDYFEHFAGTFAIDIPTPTQQGGQGVQAFSTVIQGSFFSGQVPQGGVSKPASALHMSNPNSELIVRGNYFTGISDGGVIVQNDLATNDLRGSVLIEDNKMDFANPREANKFNGVTARGNTSTTGQLAATARLSQRLASNGRTALTGGPNGNFNDPAMNGWGAGATISNISGFDQAARFTVNSGSGGITANPTVTLTFADGPWPNAPVCVASPGDGTGKPVVLTVTTSADHVTVTYQGTPVASQTYPIQLLCMGISLPQ